MPTRTTVAIAALLLACGEEPQPSTQPAPTSPEPEPVATGPADPEPAVEPEPAPADPGPIDLLRAVPTTVRVSSALGGNLEQISRLFDGDLETAWNSEREDLLGAFIEIDLPSEATVEAIEMTPGFTRNRDGRDLFTGNHRIRRVRVTRDGQSTEHSLDPAAPTLQRFAVSGSGGTVRIEMVELLPGSRPTWREVCVSELRVLGRAPGATAGAATPRTAIAPPAGPAGETPEEGEGADGEEVETDGESEEVASAPATDPAQGSLLVPVASGLRVTELVLGVGVENRAVVDVRSTISKATDPRVHCFVRLENPDRVATSITMRWERVDQPDRGRDQSLNVPAQPRYVTWGMSGTAGRAGLYRCVVSSEDGTLLASAAYELTD